jgi:ribose transport system permease protein
MESKMKKTWGDIRNGKWFRVLSSNSVVLVAVLVIIVAWIMEPKTFMTAQNWVNILRSNATVGILAFGMTFVIISGEIDLSVGSALVAIGAITMYVLNITGSVVIAVLAALAIGALFGTMTGFIVAKGRVPSFIVTLGLMYIYRSVSMYYMKGGGFFGEVEAYKAISNTLIGGFLPLPIIYFAVLVAACIYLAKYTKLGRHIYAVGSNKKSARLSGINTDKIKILTFMLMGLAVSLASIIETSRMNSINATSSGQGYEMNAIAMAVLGGTSMAGGRGTMVGTLFGILIMGIINNILTLIGVDPFLVNAIKGLIVILAVLLQAKERER